MSEQIAQTPAEANLWEDGVSSLFSTISGLPVFWRDQERPAVWPGETGFVTLIVQTDQVIGTTETRLAVNDSAAAGQEIEPSILELHTLTLDVGVETYDNLARERGRWFANRIRTRLRRESSRLALEKLSTSLIDIGAITASSIPIDGHQSSLATMSLRLHALTHERDKPFGYIETIRTTANLIGEDGSAFPPDVRDIDLSAP